MRLLVNNFIYECSEDTTNIMPFSHLALANTRWGALKPQRLSCPFCSQGRRNFCCVTYYFVFRDLPMFSTWSAFYVCQKPPWQIQIQTN